MFVGHYSGALVAKAALPRIPLWSLVLAAQAIDLAWGVLVIAGIEVARIDPSLPSNPLVLPFIPYTHGLPAAILWALLAYAASVRWLGGRVEAVVIALVVWSHWLGDFLVHRPDLPLWGNSAKVGLALWNRPAAALIVELALFLGSALLLWRSAAVPPRARRRLGCFVAVLVAAHLALTAGAAPPGPRTMAFSAMAFFIVAAGCAWFVERSPVRATSGPSTSP